MGRRLRGARGAIAILAVASALITAGVLAVGASAASSSKGKADSGTSYSVVDLTRGGFEYASGYTFDKLFGPVAITYKLKLAPATPGTFKVTAKPVVLFTPTGSLSGSATATLTVDSKGNEKITGGKVKLTKGSGGQKGHQFTGTFIGTGTASTLSFKFTYHGTYS
jgi:hypothetical protein